MNPGVHHIPGAYGEGGTLLAALIFTS